MRDEHAELRAPVTHVVDADDLVTAELQDARQAVADDGAAQMAHVHVLGDVGRAVINNNALLLHGRGDAAIHKDTVNTISDPVPVQIHVDESRSSNFCFANDRIRYA